MASRSRRMRRSSSASPATAFAAASNCFAALRMAAGSLRRVMGEWVAEVACSANLVVLRTFSKVYGMAGLRAVLAVGIIVVVGRLVLGRDETAGVLVDRLDRRRVMIGADLIRAVPEAQ